MSTLDTSELHRLTLEEYHQLIESGGLNEDTRVELIHGYLCDMSPRSREHEDVVAFLTLAIAKALDPERYQFRPGSALTLGDSEPEPDFAVVERGTARPYHPGTAALVIEVSVSSLRRDLIVKSPIYSRAGVNEYWTIDLDNERAIVHRDPQPGGYATVTTVGSGGELDGSMIGIPPIEMADVLAASAGE